MSRGGRGGGRGGFGGRGRGGFPGSSNMPPMGLSFADLASLSREPTALYPPMDPLPVLSALTPEDKEDVRHQIDFENKMRTSAYYIVEPVKSKNLPRYSDRYRPTALAHPILKRKDLNEAFFPQEIFQSYFNPKKKRKVENASRKQVNANFEELEREEQEGDADEADGDDDPEDEEENPDYDQDEEEDDNDYVEEYFDNGEGEDEDHLGGLRAGDDDGGGDTYD